MFPVDGRLRSALQRGPKEVAGYARRKQEAVLRVAEKRLTVVELHELMTDLDVGTLMFASTTTPSSSCATTATAVSAQNKEPSHTIGVRLAGSRERAVRLVSRPTMKCRFSGAADYLRKQQFCAVSPSSEPRHPLPRA
jgi:hypothetical protein